MKLVYPDFCLNISWQLHHDKAHAYSSLLIREFLANAVMMLLSCSSYPKLEKNDENGRFAKIEVKSHTYRKSRCKNTSTRWYKYVTSDHIINIDE